MHNNNELYNFAKKLWPHNRSLTGLGNRQTLIFIKNILKNLSIKNERSGKKFYDWKVPFEWHVNQAYIVTPEGKKICNFSKNNLHLVGYSYPINKIMNYNELIKNLYYLKDQPNAIPYVTSYYKKAWGFCLAYNEFKKLKKGKYKVVIDSNIFKGKLNYGELLIKGKSKKEILLSTYICHPSMANNEISGITVLTYLSKYISLKKNYFTYRIIFIPETIGSIIYICKNLQLLKKNVVAGYVLSCIGDNRSYSLLPSKKFNTLSDKVAFHVIKNIDKKFKLYNWSDRGSDERQFCSPGVDLPIATVMRTKFGCYPEYHTSLDKLGKVVTAKGLNGGLETMKKIVDALEHYCFPKYKIFCEPNLSKRNMYPSLSKKNSVNRDTKIMLDLLTWADGNHSLIDIAEKINIPVWDLYNVANLLKKNKLISLDRKES